MYLKRLEILGFKSFADKTTIHFKPGITAVVGPNGCGKSNTADAVLWALGEQSSKTLRGDRMEDFLFNGSERRKPLGLSEASLTFADVEGQIENNAFTAYRELTIARRLYRSGESEYLINKIPCRLKDIRELLIDSGAGAKGHTIIEQGKVDHILNASPLERREIVEETAGIAKYKMRKTESLRKLEATRQNIARVRDIIGEVQRQMNSLDRQVRKAERYSLLRKEIQELETRLAGFQYRSYQAVLNNLDEERGSLFVSETAASTDMSRMDATIEDIKLKLAGEEEILTRLQSDISEKDAEIQKGEHRIEVLQHQMREWELQVRRAADDLSRLERSLEEGGELLARITEETEAVADSLSGSSRRLEEEEQLLISTDRDILSLEDLAETEKTDLFSVMTAATDTRNEVASVAFRKSELQRLAMKALEEEQRLVEQQEVLDAKLNEVTRAISEADARLDEKKNHAAELRDQIAKGEEASSTCDKEHLADREALHELSARLRSLEEIRTNLTGYQDGVRTILGSDQYSHRARVRGILADLLEVAFEHEKAIEAALGDRLQTVVCDHVSDIREAIEYLREGRSGRASFISADVSCVLPDVPKTPPPGWIGRAIDLITIKPGYEDVMRALLGGTALVFDLDAAIVLWRQGLGFDVIVTLDGDMVESSGVFSGGSENHHTGLLQTRREIKMLQPSIVEAQERLASRESEREKLRQFLGEAIARLDQVEEVYHQAEVEKATRVAEFEALNQDRTRLLNHNEFLRLEREQHLEEENTLAASTETLGRRAAEFDASKAAGEIRLSELQERIKLLRRQRNEIADRLTGVKVAVTSQREKQDVLNESRRQTESLQESRRSEHAGEQARLADLRQKIKTASEEMASIRSQIEVAIGHKRAVQETLVAQSDKCSHMSQTVREQEEAYRTRRREADELSKKRQEADLRLNEIRLKLDHLTHSVYEAYREDVSVLGERFKGVEIHPEEAEEALAELKSSVNQMGPVNLTALEEFKELEERYAFLSQQEADLTEAIDSLQKAIGKINQTTRKMFMETFVQLREKFSEVFSQFFEGGRAELILLDEHNPLESGIEIAAQPPGKKLKNISLLSGGERALTAIALLFASFLIHPTPFCLLDEIDAPLDEENIRRFTQVLRHMSERSQFLIITHNKRTMETADILYGVTMEEPGVSKIVSVNLQSLQANRAAAPQTVMMAEAR